MRVSGNGKDFYEIDDTPDSVEAARSKGYKPYTYVTGNGKDIYEIEDSPDSMQAAREKGYDSLESFATKSAAQKYDATPSKMDAGISSLAKGASGGFLDELSGGVEAAGSLVGLRGLGVGDLRDVHRETGEQDKQSLMEVYREGRDQKRDYLKEAQKAHPGIFLGGELVGGVGGGIAMGGANGLATAAKVGGIMGLGDSDADLTKPSADNVWEAAKDTGKGALTGFVTQGILNTGAGTVKAAKNYLPTAVEAYKGSAASNIFGRSADSIGAMVAQNKNSRAYSGMLNLSKKNLLSRIQEGGGGEEQLRSAQSMLDKMSDQEYVLRALADGDEDVSKWVASRAGQSSPTALSPEKYEEVIKYGIDRRNAARGFDKKAEALELKPIVGEAAEAFDSAVAEKVGKHTAEARRSFDGDLKDLNKKSLSSYMDAVNNPELVPSKVASRIDKVDRILNEGTGLEEQGLREMPYSKADNEERFNRLQAMRKTIDDGIDYDAINNGIRQMNEGERVLAGLRDKVNKLLKSIPGKREADETAEKSFEIAENIFNKTEFKKGIDEFKIGRLTNGTDEAGRFKNSLDELEGWAKDESLNPEARAKAQKMVDAFRKTIGKAEDKRTLDAFQYKDGPSSAAIKGFQSAVRGQGLVQEAVLAPTGFLNNLDNFSKSLERTIGKPWSKLSDEEKVAATKLWVWSKNEAKKGLEATDESMLANFEKFLKQTGGKSGGKAYLPGNSIPKKED